MKIDADIEVYFCDPHPPCQSGVKANTSGLLEWSPKVAAPVFPGKH